MKEITFNNQKSFNNQELLNNYCGGIVVLTAVMMGLLGITQMFFNWKVGTALTILCIICIYYINYKKYLLVKQYEEFKFFRVVMIDSLIASLGHILTWINLFVPHPFSWEAFMNPPKDTIIFPFFAYIVTAMFLCPTIATNKTIMKKLLKHRDKLYN